jgi:hypothetical protein
MRLRNILMQNTIFSTDVNAPTDCSGSRRHLAEGLTFKIHRGNWKLQLRSNYSHFQWEASCALNACILRKPILCQLLNSSA